jgi:hypothetical protein
MLLLPLFVPVSSCEMHVPGGQQHWAAAQQLRRRTLQGCCML